MNAISVVDLVLITTSEPSIQGTWRSTGLDTRYTLAFCGDILEGRVGTDPILAPMLSRFCVDADEGTIDIVRDNGLQLGRFAIEGNKLILMLADVGRPRPRSINSPIIKPASAPVQIDRRKRTPPTQTRYVFERITR
jgi:hypothetical protein